MGRLDTIISPPGTVAEPSSATVNPFVADVCRTPWETGPSVDGLNDDVLDQLIDAVESPKGGPLMLLTAPRAGYGKTHLLGRVAAATGDQATMVSLAFKSGDTLTLPTITRRGLDSLANAAGPMEGWSRLRETSAGVVAWLMHRLISSGRLPSANPDQALRVLAGPVEEIFDEQGSARLIGEWLRKHQDSLRGPMAAQAARMVPVRADLLQAWLEPLMEQAFEGGASGLGAMHDLAEQDAKTGVPVWLRLLAVWRPVVLLVDHLDGFYRNAQAGVTIATLLMDLVDSHGVHVLLSLNQDVWQATFGHHLPSALEDRLTASQVLLRGLGEKDATVLLRMRLNQAGVPEGEAHAFESFLNLHVHFLGRPVGSVSARSFLRHCARQWEIFRLSPPGAVAEQTAPTGILPFPDLAETPPQAGTHGTNGTHEPVIGTLENLPTLDMGGRMASFFDADTAGQVLRIAEVLKEPKPALPQDEPPQASAPVPPPATTEEPPPPTAPLTPLIASQPAIEPSAETNESPPGVADASPPGWQPASLASLAAPAPPSLLLDEPSPAPPQTAPVADANTARAEDWSSMAAPLQPPPQRPVAPSADAFVKLREMLGRLRAPGAGGAQGMPAQAPLPSQTAETKNDGLLGRFESLRHLLAQEAQAQPLDLARLSDLVRLAGRRFPLVRYSEHELPGLTGRQVMYWSLQGMDILFGLASFTDAPYWRTLASYAAGRMADHASQAEREGRAPVRLKIVTFKTDRESFALQTLLQSQAVPLPLQETLDVVHLDGGSVASLYAMQRIIKEAEAGTLQAEPNQVMTVLARELDFFWKRVTRPG